MKGWDGMKLLGGTGDEDGEFCCRECYEFNENLSDSQDDEKCEHCRKYLTLNCKHIDEFIEDEE